MEPNLLTHEIAKIIHENGAHYAHPGQEGQAHVVEILAHALKSLACDVDTATVMDYRKLYHKHWDKILELLVPFDAQERVTSKFKGLVF